MADSQRKQLVFPKVLIEKVDKYRAEHGLNFTEAVKELVRKGLEVSSKDK